MQAQRSENDVVFFDVVNFAEVIYGVGRASPLLASDLVRGRRAAAAVHLWSHLTRYGGAAVRLHETAQGNGAAHEDSGSLLRYLLSSSGTRVREWPLITFLLEGKRIFKRAEEHLL